MKFNWKIVIALIVMAGITLWGFDSLRARPYSGTDLNFGIGSGPVTVTNQSDESVTVQLVGSGTRSFSIVNTSMDVSGTSTREGSGSRATQTYAFELPSGVNEFSVARGKDVSFVASSDALIEASVQPLSAEDSQTTRIAVAIVVLSSLFFMSHTTHHSWINRLRRAESPAEDTKPVVEKTDDGHGRTLRAYGDNRTNAGD